MTGIELLPQPHGTVVHSSSGARCKKCNALFDRRVKRGFVTKRLLFFLPIKLYYCSKCVKTRMVIN
jgi:hypothetical protein